LNPTQTDEEIYTPEEKEAFEQIRKQVLWWITDMSYKAPEQLGEGYWELMSRQIAAFAVLTLRAKL
jgi:hypothetical protein